MTIALGIEMSNPNASPDYPAVALARRGECGAIEVLAQRTMPPKARGADGVMALVQEVCADARVAPGQLDAIAVSTGPGGYTALRIATTTAKVLASTLGCRLYAVPTVEVAAKNIKDADCPALVVLASKGGRAWCAKLDVKGGARTIEVLGVVEAEIIGRAGVGSLYADMHLPEAFIEQVDRLGIQRRPIVLDARACIEVGLAGTAIEPGSLAPIYAREPDAVNQWRARGK